MEKSMDNSNRISAVLTQADVTAITDALTLIKNKLPFLVDLSPEEIKYLPKISDKSLAFVKKCLELVKQDSSFLPRSFNIEEFEKDVKLYESMLSIMQPLRMFNELAEDTYTLVGSEAYSGALAIYGYAKNARGSIAGLDDLLDDFGKKFVRKSQPQKEEVKQ